MNERFESTRLRLVRRNTWALGFAGTPLLLALLLLQVGDFTTRGAVALLLLAVPNTLLVALVMWKRNPWPWIERVAVEADRAGLRVGARLLPRSAIREGRVVPAQLEESPRVVIQPRRGAPIELEIADTAEGRALLHALGLDASQSIAVFRAMSPMLSKRPYLALVVQIVFTISGQILARNLLHGDGSILGRSLLLVAPLALFAFFMIPTRITVGADGVELRWLWQKRFLRYRELARAAVYKVDRRGSTSSGIELVLTSGKSIRLPITNRRKLDAHALMLSERIQAAMDRYPAGESESIAVVLGRRSREIPAWIRALRYLGAGANAGMRTAPVPRDRLFEIVEDASMEPAARAAAAVALGPELDARGRARLRAAAEATAAPRLRIAIEAAAEGLNAGEDAAIEAALAEIEAEGAKPRAME